MKRTFLVMVVAGVLCCDHGFAGPSDSVELLQVINTDCQAPAGIRVSPDGKRIFCFSFWTTVRQFDISDKPGKEIPLPRLLKKQRIFAGMPVAKDLWLLAMDRRKFQENWNGYFTQFVLFDLRTNTIKADWTAHHDLAGALAIAPKQKWIITAGNFFEEGQVCFWDLKKFKKVGSRLMPTKVGEIDLIKTLKLRETVGGDRVLETMAIDSTSSFLAFGFREGQCKGGPVVIWDMAKKKWLKMCPEGIGRSVRSLCFVGKRWLAVGWENKDIHNWDKPDCVEVYDWKAQKLVFTRDMRKKLSDMVVSGNGKLLALGDTYSNAVTDNEEGRIYLWDARTKRQVADFTAHDSAIIRMTFTPDGTKLISNCDSGLLKIWDVKRLAGTEQKP